MPPDDPTRDTSWLDRLHRRLLADPQADALVAGGQHVGLGRLWSGGWAVARALADLGVAAGDRVLLQLEPGVAWVEAWIGILLAGAVAVPLSPQLPAPRLHPLLDELEPAAWLRSQPPAAAERQRPGRRALPPVLVDGPVPAGSGLRPWPVLHPTLEPPPRRAPEALAAILYTSGTRGEPKGAMLGHGHFAFAADVLRQVLGLRTGDRILCLLPLHHTYGLSQLVGGLPAGACVRLEPAPAWPAQLLQRIAASGCTVLPATPTLVAQLAALREPQAVALPALRAITLAADALPPGRLAWMRRTWPTVSLWSMYGQTECGRASILDAACIDTRPDSVGRGLPGTELWLVDEQGRRVEGAGRGELVVRGPHLMQGYWRRPDETAEVLRPDPDGGPAPVLHTGDWARRDAEGYLTIEGRRDDLIQCRGERISPRQIEAVLRAHPDVAEAVVVGRPDPALGRRIEAHVVPRPGARTDAAALAGHLRHALEPALWPQRIQFHAALPKTELGKLATGRLPPSEASRDAHAPPAGPDPPLHPGQLPPRA